VDTGDERTILQIVSVRSVLVIKRLNCTTLQVLLNSPLTKSVLADSI
jgi:hypothetical protein